MRYVSPDTELGRPEGFTEGLMASDVWDRAREWLDGGRLWSAALVFLLTLSIAKSTIAFHWVDGIDVILPIALGAVLVMSVLALLPIPAPIGLGAGVVLGPVVAILGAWPRIHANHPADVLGPQLVNVWWTRLQDGSAANDQSFYLVLICLLMWITGGWLTWCVLRWRRPMLGLVPGAAAFATNVLNLPPGNSDQNGYVLAILVLTLALLLWTNYTGSIANAGTASVRLTGDAKWDFWESGLVAMAALIVLGIMLPPISTSDRTLDVESGVFTSWAQLQSRLSNPGIFTSSGGHGVTGFASDVKLSGALKRSADPVFEWTVKGTYGGPKYFRGINITQTVGGEWRYSGTDALHEVIPANGYPDYQESYEKLGLATVDVTMRAPPAGFTSVMFYPGQLYRVNRATLATQVPLGGVFDQTLESIDRLDAIKGTSTGTYAVTAEFSTATVEDLQGAGTQYPSWLGPFIGLPQNDYRSPGVLAAIHNQALDVVNAAHATNPYDMATAIESWLRNPNNFRYSLDATPASGMDPIYWFLFKSKVGYCEFFATAMGDMLRSLGIPTRLVNGYGPGQFNAQTEGNVVRAEDAHTWVEVYFPTYGWIPFEPTADDLGNYQPIPRGLNGSNLCLRDQNCNDPGQVTAGPTGGTVVSPKGRPGLGDPNVGVGPAGLSLGKLSPSVLTDVLGVLLALLLLLAALGARYLRPGTVAAVWKRTLVLARLAGAERRLGETPLELGRRLERTFPEAAGSMRDLTGAFVIAAYAPPDEASMQRSSVMEAWVALRPMLLRRVLARLKPTRL